MLTAINRQNRSTRQSVRVHKLPVTCNPRTIHESSNTRGSEFAIGASAVLTSIRRPVVIDRTFELLIQWNVWAGLQSRRSWSHVIVCHTENREVSRLQTQIHSIVRYDCLSLDLYFSCKFGNIYTITPVCWKSTSPHVRLRTSVEWRGSVVKNVVNTGQSARNC